MIPLNKYRLKLLYVIVLSYYSVYSVPLHCLLVNCCILVHFLCAQLVLLVFWGHGGGLLFCCLIDDFYCQGVRHT